MKYTETHEWITVQNDVGTVGITNHAQHELGDIVYVELPKVGKAVRKGQEAAVLESTKAAADVYAPVSGTITAVNDALAQTPELVNTASEDTGWLFKIKLDNKDEMGGLMDLSAYKQSLPH